MPTYIRIMHSCFGQVLYSGKADFGWQVYKIQNSIKLVLSDIKKYRTVWYCNEILW